MQKRFVPGRMHRLSVVCCLVFFLAIDVASVCLAIFGPDRGCRLVGGCSALFWGGWVLFSSFAVAQSRYDSIEINDGWLTCHSLFGSKRIEIASVADARWKTRG